MSLAPPRALAALALSALLACPLWGDEKKPKPPKPPKPTPSERTEIRQLMGQLGRGRHEAKRSQAAAALGKFGPTADMAIPALAQALNDRDTNVGCAAADALARVGPYSKQGVEALVKTLSAGRAPELKAAAAAALGQIGPFAAKPATSPLLAALQGGDEDLRRKAAASLGLLGEEAAKAATEPLKKALASSDSGLRLAAAMSLARFGDSDPELVKTLAAAVRKSGRAVVEIRQSACEVLELLGPKGKEAVGALSEAAGEKPEINPALPYADQRLEQHEAFRRAAVRALGAIGGEEVRPALERAAKVPSLAEEAERALAKLKG